MLGIQIFKLKQDLVPLIGIIKNTRDAVLPLNRGYSLEEGLITLSKGGIYPIAIRDGIKLGFLRRLAKARVLHKLSVIIAAENKPCGLLTDSAYTALDNITDTVIEPWMLTADYRRKVISELGNYPTQSVLSQKGATATITKSDSPVLKVLRCYCWYRS